MSEPLFKRPRGTADVSPEEIYKWHYVENILKNTADNFAFREIRFPTFESTGLFLRGVGEDTDVVQKEIYSFIDKGGRDISLRPEGTASVVRSYIENGLFNLPAPLKVFYIAPNFRYEKPQAGRYREHHQFGVEVLGTALPQADAELISFAYTCLCSVGISDITANINSIGCNNCRPAYYDALRKYLSANEDRLCDTCKTRLVRNPLRVLDCKSEICSEIAAKAPKPIDMLCDDCREHLEAVKHNLTALNIPWKLDPTIVRGLDYYTKTVFEFSSPFGAVCGGGRYDNLVSQLGGPETPALGFGMGLERLISVLESTDTSIPAPKAPDIYLVPADANGQEFAAKLAFDLRKNGISVITELCGRSVKAQMKAADKLNVRFTAVIGENEVAANNVNLKNMQSGENISLTLNTAEITEFLKNN